MLANTTYTLPPAASAPGSLRFVEKSDSSIYTITIVPTGSDTIDGATGIVLRAQWSAVMVMSDGVSNWMAMGQTSVLIAESLAGPGLMVDLALATLEVNPGPGLTMNLSDELVPQIGTSLGLTVDSYGNLIPATSTGKGIYVDGSGDLTVIVDGISIDLGSGGVYIPDAYIPNLIAGFGALGVAVIDDALIAAAQIEFLSGWGGTVIHVGSAGLEVDGAGGFSVVDGSYYSNLSGGGLDLTSPGGGLALLSAVLGLLELSYLGGAEITLDAATGDGIFPGIVSATTVKESGSPLYTKYAAIDGANVSGDFTVGTGAININGLRVGSGCYTSGAWTPGTPVGSIGIDAYPGGSYLGRIPVY